MQVKPIIVIRRVIKCLKEVVDRLYSYIRNTLYPYIHKSIFYYNEQFIYTYIHKIIVVNNVDIFTVQIYIHKTLLNVRLI